MSLLDEADAYVARNGVDLPEEPDARKIEADPQCVTVPILDLSLAEAGITSIIWATGFTVDYSWLKVDAFDERGRPKHQRGVSIEPGIYFLGLPWQSRRASSFIWGVWYDAKHLADRISTQRKYLAYHASAKRETQVALPRQTTAERAIATSSAWQSRGCWGPVASLAACWSMMQTNAMR